MLLPQTVALFLALAYAATVPKPISLRPLPLDRTFNRSSLQNNVSTTNIPHPFNELFFYHIPDTTLDLYIRDTGDRMPLSDIYSCLRALESRIVAEITARGFTALSHPMTSRYGVVAVVLTPYKLSCGNAGIVINTLETLILHDGWTYASHVSIEDQHERLVVGSLSIRYYAKDPSPGIREPISPSPIMTHTNSSLTNPPRPSSPYPYVIPNSHISLIFAAYGRNLSLSTVMTLFLDAQIYISMRVRVLGPLALIVDADDMPPWKLGGVVLEFFPGPRLRWYDLLIAMEGLVDFVGSFGAFACTFEVRWQGFRELGMGSLRAGS